MTTYTVSVDQTISAIFAAGVFRPLEPLDLAEGTRVVVQVANSADAAGEVDKETQLAWSEYIDRMESMSDNSPRDGLTGRDHDRIFYGG